MDYGASRTEPGNGRGRLPPHAGGGHAGSNDKSWLDVIGHPHSEALRVVERYRRRDFGHMDLEMTFDDPQMYTKPFTIKVAQDLLADSDLFESFCNENEKDRPHLNQQ